MSFNTFYLNSENSSGIIDGSNVVIGGRLGISIDPPQHTLDVSGTTRSTNLLATTATIDNLDISGETVDITSLQTKVENTQMVSFTVIVASKTSNAANSGGSSSDYVINNVETPYLHFTAGKTYRFDQSDSTNSTHPILFYLDENKTSQYSSGVTTVGSAGTSGAYVEISITSNTPETIYYQCQNHAYMGGKIYVKGSNVTAITSVGTLTAGTWNASTIQKQYINTSSISVNDLSDVSFNSTSTTDGQALVWNATDGVWEAGVVAGSGGGLADLSASSITDLSDVSFNTSSITNGQTLVWNASDAVWEAGTIQTNSTNTTTLISNNHGDFKLLEKITGVCDGRTISGESTAYTLQQVSNYQDISTILVDVNGSSISYTPPNNTNQVLYNFKFNVVDLSGDATVFNQNHTLTLTLHLFIDDVEIENQRAQISNYIYNNGHYFTYSAIIDIGSVETDDVANGKYASWTSSKVIKLKAANSHYDYPVQLFSIKTESLGTFVSTFVPPTIEVASIGNVDNISFSTVSANDLSDISFNTTYTNNGQALLWDSTNGVWTPGSVATNSIISNVMSNNYGNFKPLEKIAGVCDGRTITGDPNTYTLKQVTTYQDISTTLVDVNGSSIAYTPPYNATQVLYNFKFNVVDLSGDATVFNQNYTLTLTLHLYIDGVEITNQKAQISNYMFNNGHYFTYSAVIDIGSVEFDDIENGKYAVWNTSKVIKLKAANSHYDYPVRLFSIKTVSLGSYVHTFVPPIIEVASIGDISNISFASVSIGDLSDVSFNSTTTTDGQTLVWNSTDAVWETGTVVGSGGGGGGIADLSDVSFNSATTANYQPLTWNTTNQTWEPSTTMSIDTIQEKTTNNGVIVENVTLNNGSVTVPSDISAHHVYGVNYHVGSKTIVSASAQANFNDLEVKNSTTNTTTLLVLGQSEVMELSGTFKTDIIEEKTNNNGVIIEGVTIKNNSITAGSNGSISATNFNIGSRNIVSAAAQANFTDLEVKNSITNTTTLLVLGQSGVMELSGTLKTDIIEEKTANNGVDIEGVLLKDADISANDVSFNNIHVLGDISFNGNLYQNGTLFQSGSGGGGGGGGTIDETTDVSMNNTTIHGILDVSTNFTAGGRTSTTTTISETIQWYTNQSNFTWSLTNDGTSTAPTARKNHSSIIDNSSNIVIFGGYDSTNSETNDVWKYNITNNAWSQLFTSTTPSDGAWDQITGSTATSIFEGATVYNNEIYVISDSHSKFEKYNPYTNTWTTLSAPSSASFYSYHQMVSYNGHIYLVDNVNGYRSVWDYNISTSTWSQISNTSDTSHDRYNAAIMVYNNNIYILGGRHIPYTGGFFNDIWKFNLTNNTWSEITGTTVTLDSNSSSMPSIAYSYFTSKDDNLYMFGGTNGTLSNKLYIYNVTNNTLTGYTTSISARDSGTASIQGNYLYLFGGYTTSNLNELIKYDLIAHTHTTISQSGTWPSARRDLQAKPVTIGNTFYLIGGYTSGHSTEIWRYTLDNTPNKLKHSSSVLNGDEIVTIFGGSNGNTYYNSIYNFNLVSNSWLYPNVVNDNNASETEHGNSSGAPSPRDGHTSVEYNNKMYMFGGKDGSTTYYDTWEYDLTTTTWTKKALAQSSYARYEHSSIIYNGDMYVFGGYDGTNYFNNILKYDITNDTWSEYNDGTALGTPTARYGHISAIMQNEMIIFGGTTQSGHVEDSYMFNFVDSSWNLLDNDDSNRPTDSYSTTAEIQYYNPTDNHYKLFVFGGETPLTNKLYVVDISRNNVTNTTSTTTPHILTFNSTNGRVGIGTNTPSKSLDVGGDINFTGSLYQNGSVVNIGSSTFNQNTDLTINTLTTVNDISFGGNLYQNGSLFTGSGGVSSGDDISFNNLDISGVLATNKSNNEIKLGAHIIPTTNSTYDLGSAEYKIRHLFLSSNSLWVGDDHKIDISGGKMRFKKRKKASVPTSIANAGGTDSGALAFAGVAQLADIQLHQWEAYAHTLGGLEAATIADIFQTELSNDWEEDFEAGKDTNPTITNIAYSSETVRTAALSTDWNSAVIPWKTSTLKRLYYNDANVGINKTYASYTLDVGGSIASSTGLVSGSDDRIKHNEQPITNALSTISKLTPKHYFKTGTKMYDASHNFVVDTLGTPLDESGNPLKFKEEYTIETGIIAQEIRTIPELQFAVYGEEYVEETVTTYKKDNFGNDILDDSGNKIVENVETKQKPNTLAVDYNSIHCTHIAATKELHQLVESQQTTIEEQQNEIEHLKLVNQDINTQLNTALTELETIKQYLGI